MRLTPLPAFSDNYIWTLSDDRGRALVVDPGDADPVLAAARAGLEPIGVLLTHHHDDHIGGVPTLLEHWPGLPVFGPADPRIPFVTETVADGAHVRLDDWHFEVLAVPGHTRSHVAFHGHGLLFSGDTLFSLGCGRLFEGTPADMLGSLQQLAALPAGTRVCCGHEYTLTNAAFARVVDPDNQALRRRHEEALRMRQLGQPTLPTRMDEELACNPFLRIDALAVRDSLAARQPGLSSADRTDAFAALRRWKDDFRA